MWRNIVCRSAQTYLSFASVRAVRCRMCQQHWPDTVCHLKPMLQISRLFCEHTLNLINVSSVESRWSLFVGAGGVDTRSLTFWLMCLFEPMAPDTRVQRCWWLLRYLSPQLTLAAVTAVRPFLLNACVYDTPPPLLLLFPCHCCDVMMVLYVKHENLWPLKQDEHGGQSDEPMSHHHGNHLPRTLLSFYLNQSCFCLCLLMTQGCLL